METKASCYQNYYINAFLTVVIGYESWRRLGDLSSSLFALGYHQQLESSGPIPPFLRSLRQAAFACSYSADKNVSIFLGRPPRISRKFCHFRQLSLDAYYSYDWAADSQLDLFADTRWAALCAILKEEIIVELFGEERFDNRVEKARLAISFDVSIQLISLAASKTPQNYNGHHYQNIFGLTCP